MARYNNVFLRFMDKDGVTHFPDYSMPTVTSARQRAKEFAFNSAHINAWAETENAHEKVATVKVMNRGRGDSDTHPEEVLGEYEVKW